MRASGGTLPLRVDHGLQDSSTCTADLLCPLYVETSQTDYVLTPMVGLERPCSKSPTPRRARPVTAARRVRAHPSPRGRPGASLRLEGAMRDGRLVRHPTARWLDARKAGGSTLRSPAARRAKGRRFDTRKARWFDARQGRGVRFGLGALLEGRRSIAGLRFGIEAVMASRRGAARRSHDARADLCPGAAQRGLDERRRIGLRP
jgi:hypothetical protein